MKSSKYLFQFSVCCISFFLAQAAYAQDNPAPPPSLGDFYSMMYNQNCAVCHGEQLEGAAQGTPLIGELKHGDNMDAITQSISRGFPEKGMPSWGESLSPTHIKSLALYVTETRSNFNYSDFNVSAKLEIPSGTIKTERHSFKIETVIDSLDPLPYSIEPLPDGRILLTEKKRGLTIISQDGKQSALIEGAPKAYDDTTPAGMQLEFGNGWLLDVALHPDYDDNGWIYFSYGDRCSDCNAVSKAAKIPVSMNKLIRGRIQNGRWTDEQVIWEVDRNQYGPSPDMVAGGRITFDDNGHVFMSVGMKGTDNHTGIQNLGVPWGKIYRVNDDGSIPKDNPFVNTEGAIKSIWTYGHRSPQGLEFNHQTGELWGTEMGPRGGDEVNRLIPGGNFGWPLYSLGLDYDGTAVEYGKEMGIDFDLRDIQQPVVDLTPSPAVSSFIFYSGDAFPKWKNNLLVGSLKARSVYRMEMHDNKVTYRETIIKDLARIRDIETGPAGEIYLLLEHESGGQIVRLTSTQ